MKKLLSIALSLIMVLSLFACGKKKETVDYVEVMQNTGVLTLNSLKVIDSESLEVLTHCIDGLTEPDADGKAVGALASDWDISADGLTWTFHLRDAKWSNGEPVTASDFVFAWQTAVSENVEYAYLFGSYGASVKNADAILSGKAKAETLGVTAVDEKTLSVELSAPVSFLDTLLNHPVFYPINQKFYESCKGTYGTSAKAFLACGAFVPEEYEGSGNVTLIKNKDYWNADKVSLEGLRYRVIDSSEKALSEFKEGTLDVAVLSGSGLEAAKADADLSGKIQTVNSGALWYLSFSQKDGKSALANQNLRLALTNAIDRESLVSECLKDGSLATYTAVSRGVAYSTLTGEDFASDQKKFSDFCSYDNSMARAYLAAAQAELSKTNFSFTLIYGDNEGGEVASVAKAVKATIEENLPGVTVTLKAMSKSQRIEKMLSGDYEIVLTRGVPDYADPMSFFVNWTTGNAMNSTFWSNRDYDDLIAECSSGALASNYEARWSGLFSAETMVMKEAVIAPLYTKADSSLISDHLTGVQFRKIGAIRVFKNAKVTK